MPLIIDKVHQRSSVTGWSGCMWILSGLKTTETSSSMDCLINKHSLKIHNITMLNITKNKLNPDNVKTYK